MKDGTWSDEEGRREKLAQAAAQAGALKLTDKNINLTQEEMVDLVAKLFECDSPAIDSRGRAVFTLFSLEDIEKILK